MRKIYIFDYIGIHCGMHYYNAVFKELLEEIPDVRIEILSNYADGGRQTPFLKNFYRKNKLLGAIILLYDFLKLLVKRISEPKAEFIVLSYGNPIDVVFIFLACIVAQHTVIDIHEAVAQDAEHKPWLVAMYRFLYAHCVKTVIFHSERTRSFLHKFGFKGQQMYVPHFKYALKKDYDTANLADDVRGAISADKTNVLFFGNLTYNKGVDILLDAYRSLPESDKQRLNIIVAGRDIDGTVGKSDVEGEKNVHLILRHINDDELVFLYGSTDFIALPYRKTSQSGILEMAFYFRKPIVASRIEYFEFMLGRFPSFGILTDFSVNDYAATLAELPMLNRDEFYKSGEYDLYCNRKEMAEFIKDFKQYLNA